MVGWFVEWLVGGLVGWLVIYLLVWLVSCLNSWLFVCLVGLLLGWLVFYHARQSFHCFHFQTITWSFQINIFFVYLPKMGKTVFYLYKRKVISSKFLLSFYF